MDKLALKSAAERLERAFAMLAGDPEAAALREAMAPLIDAAKCARIDEPRAWRDIPGGRLFSEGSLRRHANLECAYSAFCVELTCGESDVLRNLKAEMRGRQESSNKEHRD